MSARLDALESAVGGSAATPSPEAALVSAIEAIQQRLAAIEDAAGPAPARPSDVAVLDPDRDELRFQDYWLLERLARNTGPKFTHEHVSGSVAFGGMVHTGPDTPDFSWQAEYTLPDVLAADLASAAAVLAAMGHPLRLEVLRRLLLGASTVGELQEIEGIGTTGQVHHHIRELRAAGLVVSRRRNHYAVPGDRVVHMLVMISAALGRRVIGRAGPPPDLRP